MANLTSNLYFYCIICKKKVAVEARDTTDPYLQNCPNCKRRYVVMPYSEIRYEVFPHYGEELFDLSD